MRKLDYYSICYTSTVLRSAAHIRLPNSLKVASLLVAPFKPTLVTGLNLVLVEVSLHPHAPGTVVLIGWMQGAVMLMCDAGLITPL